jgi:proteic killer suppression protein
MLISFKSKKFGKECNDPKLLTREWGAEQARLIARRLTELAAADNLATLRTLPQARAHELKGNREEQISLDVKHPYRLIVIPDYDDPPRRKDGGLDWKKITKIKILEVIDTHE